ncbi:2-deoxy-D-gluconate 3-dehydrogenase, partial [Vibrio parahaemolyticus]|nr:2-deoxy-D-gluconate 3-dehydrogenase [Vibrio parahaemolyticus]
MILDSFNLEGKVAIVTGCDTGLGQGMALGL